VSAPPSPSSRYIIMDKIDKIHSCLRYICSNLQTTRVIPVGLLASVIWQLISTQAVLGKSVRIRTRYAYDCVAVGLFLGNNKTKFKEIFFYHQTDLFTFLKCVSSTQSIVKIHYDSNALWFKYKYEDATVARQMFYKGDFMFSYDLKSAYHHIMMHPMNIKYLGFQWKSPFHQ
jgi:hypothetical protein